MILCMFQSISFPVLLSPALVSVSESVRKCMLGGMDRVYRIPNDGEPCHSAHHSYRQFLKMDHVNDKATVWLPE